MMEFSGLISRIFFEVLHQETGVTMLQLTPITVFLNLQASIETLEAAASFYRQCMTVHSQWLQSDLWPWQMRMRAL